MNNLAPLYELSGQYLQLANTLSELDLDVQTIHDTIEASGLTDDIAQKLTGLEMVARGFEASTPAIDAEIARLTSLKMSRTKRAQGLREYAKRNMIACGIDKIETPLFKIRLQNNPASVDIFEPGLVPACIAMNTNDVIMTTTKTEVTIPAQNAEICEWTPMDDESPGSYDSACGAAWSFTEGGIAENNIRFCHGCGRRVVELTEECFCDANNLGLKGVSCGDCPRDYTKDSGSVNRLDYEKMCEDVRDTIAKQAPQSVPQALMDEQVAKLLVDVACDPADDREMIKARYFVRMTEWNNGIGITPATGGGAA